ncbi:MAG: ferrochelatase [Nitrospirae bacterium]|nr:ferrochelatase [Nitrospirota bacterium]
MIDTADRKTDHTIAVLLLNLGGPDSLDAVRPFLYNLFSDRDIIRLGPSFLQKPVARLISTFRSSKSRRMYGMIGGRSPILEITTAQAEALEKSLNAEVEKIENLEDKKTSAFQQLSFLTSQPSCKVYIGMRYWHPYIKDAVKKIMRDGINEVIVLSLYPHYSKTTTGSSVSAFRHAAEETGLSIKYIECWFDFPPYIDALCELIHEGIQEFRGEDIFLLYSAHSLPKSFIDEGDPYLDHIKGTIEAANKRLSEEPYNIRDIKWGLSFQSRSGPVEWLEPATDDTIIKLGEKGCRNILVVPISFVSDHIETLYEVDILFMKLAEGQGMNLRRCGSLNTSEKFINALKELVMIKMREAQ